MKKEYEAPDIEIEEFEIEDIISSSTSSQYEELTI